MPGAEQAVLPLDAKHTSETSNDVDASRIFDRASLLKRMMDYDDLAETIVASFLDDMPGQITTLKGFVENGQAEQAGRQAHKIKGAAANISALVFQETAHAMEDAGMADDIETLRRLMPELEQKFLQLKKHIETDESSEF